MTTRFSSLVSEYLKYFTGMSGRVMRCAPTPFLISVPLVSVSQVLFILSFMLPLKVIILIGMDGVPDYLTFLVTEQTRQQWIILLSLATVGCYLLYLGSESLLSRLSRRGGAAIRRQSGKATLFHGEEELAQSVFLRVSQSWGTALMVVGGVGLGLVLEWRLAAVLLAAVVIEVFFLARLWNHHQLPEHSEARESFVQNRGNTFQTLAGVNTFLAFGMLVFLFLADPDMNFIIGLVMFILTRQVMQRLVIGVQDANVLLQQRERIEALVDPGRHVREKRQPTEVTFEMLLLPERRNRLFEAVASQGHPELSQREWAWCDCAARGQALYVSRGRAEVEPEYRLKVVRQGKDAGLAREDLFYRSGSARELGLAAELVGTGEVFGRGFLAMKSVALRPLSAGLFPELARQVRFSLWRHTPDEELAARLGRSFASLPDRLDAQQLGRIRLGCNLKEEELLLDGFLGQLGIMQEMVDAVPRVLINRDMSPANMLVTEAGRPVLLNWDAIALDSIGVDLTIADLEKAYKPEEVLSALSGSGTASAETDPRLFRLVVHLSNLEKTVAREAYRQALQAIPPIVQVLEEAGVTGLPACGNLAL